nr:hypothetical protein [Candidatus Sigynarchaeota archaeon]
MPLELIEMMNDRTKAVVDTLGLKGYFPTSSKTNTNVDEMFAALLGSILERAKREKQVAASSHA